MLLDDAGQLEHFDSDIRSNVGPGARRGSTPSARPCIYQASAFIEEEKESVALAVSYSSFTETSCCCQLGQFLIIHLSSLSQSLLILIDYYRPPLTPDCSCFYNLPFKGGSHGGVGLKEGKLRLDLHLEVVFRAVMDFINTSMPAVLEGPS